jgi:hypothetical protein
MFDQFGHRSGNQADTSLQSLDLAGNTDTHCCLLYPGIRIS